MSSSTQRRLRISGAVFCGVILIALSAFAWVWSRLRASLPVIDGEVAVAGLGAKVTVERDALGVPTLQGGTRLDLSRGLGYVHAQDRYFQMDLTRRRAAGELAELFGAGALPLDRGARLHELRTLAQRVLETLPANQRASLDAYAAGANAGLAQLNAKPWEYFTLRLTPQPWLPEDSLLCLYAMALDLQEETGNYERTLMTLRDELGSSSLAFFAPLVGPADAALDGSTAPLPQPPGPRIMDVRGMRKAPSQTTASTFSSEGALTSLQSSLAHVPYDPEFKPGSNSFGIAGATPGTPATLENDMHLSLSVPGVWYRARMRWTDAGASPKSHDVTGVTLPGTPAVVAGSNGSIAWGFTNSYTDTGDLVLVQPDEVTPETLYVNNGKAVEFERHTQRIRVKGGPDEEFVTRWTAWGPVVGETSGKKPLAFKWIMQEANTANFQLMDLENSQTVDEAIAIVHTTGIPAQNILIADKNGALAWTIAGRLPQRFGHDGRLPVSWAYGDRGWSGLLPPAEVPVHRAAPGELIWSANQRMLGGEALTKLGDGGYESVARSARLRDRGAQLVATMARQPVAPPDFLAVALDNRADYLDRWQKKLLETLKPGALTGHADRAEFRTLVENWQGRASVDSVSYRLVRHWRDRVANRVMSPIFASCHDAWAPFSFRMLPYEHPLWALLDQQPLHLLAAEYPTWDDLLLASVDDVIASLNKSGVPLKSATWGDYNTVTVRHPFSRILPGWLSKFIDMPAQPLPGDWGMPRAQSRTDGASERFVITPGNEKDAIFHMPAGQSGHFLSPFYRAGHQAWVQGEATALLPGPAIHTLALTP